MTLSASDRLKLGTGLMRYWSRLVESHGLLKSDLSATIDATDDWIEASQASYNSALPLAAQTGLTASQKTLVFCIVAAMRVSKAFAVSLVGGVD